jgi:predicted small integral membrane protein
VITRTAKLLLLAGVAFFYSLVVFNNLTDFNSNYQLVRHVLMMDTTFPGNHGMWRALTPSAAGHSFYIAIIVWEIVTAILLWWGCLALSRAIRRSAMNFEAAKRIPVIALTLSLLMWLVAFISVGGEWFLMWQSRAWNGEETAFRDFTMVGIVLLVFMFPERDVQP